MVLLYMICLEMFGNGVGLECFSSNDSTSKLYWSYTGTQHIRRGGSYDNSSEGIQVSNRFQDGPVILSSYNWFQSSI
jgi:hypothetical protein